MGGIWSAGDWRWVIADRHARPILGDAEVPTSDFKNINKLVVNSCVSWEDQGRMASSPRSRPLTCMAREDTPMPMGHASFDPA